MQILINQTRAVAWLEHCLVILRPCVYLRRGREGQKGKKGGKGVWERGNVVKMHLIHLNYQITATQYTVTHVGVYHGAPVLTGKFDLLPLLNITRESTHVTSTEKIKIQNSCSIYRIMSPSTPLSSQNPRYTITTQTLCIPTIDEHIFNCLLKLICKVAFC